MMLVQSIQKGVFKALKQATRLSCNQSLFRFSSDANNEGDSNQKKDGKVKKEDIFIHKENYNQEQFKQYTKEVKAALQDFNEQQTKLENSSAFDLLPRRKRRIYNRPLHDLDIANYDAWRTYDKLIFKGHKHAAPVVCKLNISPKQLRHVFGEGQDVSRNFGLSTREYDFEDNNMDSFLVYDYKATTDYHGENLEAAEYEKQDKLPEKKRKQPHPTPKEFWESDEIYQFRVNCTPYADFHKFKKWIETEIEKKKTEKSYEEKIIERFGSFEIYDKFEAKYEIEKDPSVYKYGRNFYLEKGKQYSEKEIQNNPYMQPIKPAKQMDDKYRVTWPYQWNPKPANK